MKPKITIIGAGKSGTGAALLAQQKGYAPRVYSRDPISEPYKTTLQKHAIYFEEKIADIKNMLETELIVKSPGVPLDLPLLDIARTKKIPIIDEIEFAFQYLKGKSIAITGTNGKTTVARLIHHLLKTAGIHAALAGNVGNSLAQKITNNTYDWYVIEISSFQLEAISTFRPDISILLNITPDHMDRYHFQFENYVNTKLNLIQKMQKDDYFIYFMDDPAIARGIKNRVIKGKKIKLTTTGNTQADVFFDGLKMYFQFTSPTFCIPQQNSQLRGIHNTLNMMASIAAARLAGVSVRDLEKGIASFKNSPHRLEWITAIEGVEFVNDSKATNVDAVKYAMASYKKPLIWIAGGLDKGNNYDQIRKQVQKKVKMLFCMGKENKKLKDYFSTIIPRIKEEQDIKKLVRMALKEADKGDVVLLSPACSSFDLFTGYEDRGDQFKQAVLTLKHDMEKKKL